MNILNPLKALLRLKKTAGTPSSCDSAGAKITYTVYSDDNYHYMDASERLRHGEYKTYEAALKVAKKIVERSLQELRDSPDITTAKELLRMYVMYGEDPFIVPTKEGESRFSARDYARARCDELFSD